MFELKQVNIKNKAGNFIFPNIVDFKIQESQIWIIKANNGIGKTSLYESLFGIRNIEEGEIWFNNENITFFSPESRIKMGIKYVSQNNALFEFLTIKQNLELCAEFLLPKEKRELAVEKAIELFNLKELENNQIKELSGGQKRLTELSKILIGECKFVLLDEPFAAIDENIISNLQKIFLYLKNNFNISFLINDHNFKAVNEISDYCIYITKKNIKLTNNNNNLLNN